MHINIRSYGIIMLLMIAMIACRSVPVSEASYPQADKKLAEFDKENPDCQLWTNWQKMCSRTGENGATWCTTDPDHPVEPSEPFCTDAYLGYQISNLSNSQVKSILRFCVGFYKKIYSSMDPRFCFQFDRDRPFSGYNIAARRHPWCEKWLNIANQKNNLESRLFCSKWNLPIWCKRARDFYDYAGVHPIPNDELQSPFEGVFFTSQIPLAAPVYGVQCEIRKGK